MIRKWRLGLGLLLLIAGAVGAVLGWQRWERNTRDAVRFKKALIETLAATDEVRVTEHSDRSDFLSQGEKWSGPLPQFEYQAITLSGAQKALLLEEVENMSSYSKRWLPGCGPVIHHTFRFVLKSGQITTMEVCFHCGQVVWQGGGIVEPENGLERLADFLKRIGLHPQADWEKLGKDRLKDVPDAPHEILPPPPAGR